MHSLFMSAKSSKNTKGRVGFSMHYTQPSSLQQTLTTTLQARPPTCLAAFFRGFFWQQKQQHDSREMSRQAAPATAKKKYTPLTLLEPVQIQ